MGGSPTDRSQWKEAFHSFRVELEEQFGLSPVASRALVRRIEHFIDTVVAAPSSSRSPGQISYSAVAASERAGKPIRYCLTLSVSLTLLHPGDAQVLHGEGSPALRRHRMARLCAEARRQAGALSHEDLALLLGLELSSIRRMAADLAGGGNRPPTRGLLADIGPAVSHKEAAIRLYFQGLLPNQIAVRLGHSLGSVERYLADFARVGHLAEQGLPPQAISRITALSAPLVRRYRGLFRELAVPGNASVLERLLRRFGPIEPTPTPEGDHE